MAPGSNRRGALRSRKEGEGHVLSDADTPEAIPTPSRKRRKVTSNGQPAQNGAASVSTATTTAEPAAVTRERTASAQTPDSETHDEEPTTEELQTDVVRNLKVASYVVRAAALYNNDLQGDHNRPAYGKICGRDWTYFMRQSKVVIGRSEHTTSGVKADESQETSTNGVEAPSEASTTSQFEVQIDLGPDRAVSRVHAVIDYRPEMSGWYLTVNGRNGVKLDRRMLQRGEVAALHSGVVLSILGTQMLFITPDVQPQYHPYIIRQTYPDREEDDESENGENGKYNPRQPSPAPPSSHMDPFPPSSVSRQRPSSQRGHGNQAAYQPGTPLAGKGHMQFKTKGSPATYARGIVMDSTEDIDYSLDSAKDLKPPHSYAQLIGQAILSSPEEMLTLANIYNFIKERYAFYRHSGGGWQNSIRHNLSLSKTFEKVARRTDEPGKGMKWRIAESEREEFLKKTILNPRGRQGLRVSSSGPNSPATGNPPSQATERLLGAMGYPDSSRSTYSVKHESGNHVKTPPRSATPPLASYPTATESYTPDRGPRQPVHRNGFAENVKTEIAQTPLKPLHSALSGPSFVRAEPSPVQRESNVRERQGLNDSAAQSPPPLYSSSGISDPRDASGSMGNPLVTPLVARHAPRLAPPSTAQVPSQFLQFSSPAPFWKFADNPSTPAMGQNLDLSPEKLLGAYNTGTVKRRRRNSDDDPYDNLAQPSSPPALLGGAGEDDERPEIQSPTRSISRPVSRRQPSVTKGPIFSAPLGSGAVLINKRKERSTSSETEGRTGDPQKQFGPALAEEPTKKAGDDKTAGAAVDDEDDDEEEEGLDLAKGFQQIGAFHRHLSQGGGGMFGHLSQPQASQQPPHPPSSSASQPGMRPQLPQQQMQQAR